MLDRPVRLPKTAGWPENQLPDAFLPSHARRQHDPAWLISRPGSCS